jgi:hypothetical protein
MNRKWALLIGPSLLVAGVMCGCGPRLSPEELGTIEYDIPKVPGSDKPYPLPELEGSAETPADSDAVPTSGQPNSDEASGDRPSAAKPVEATATGATGTEATGDEAARDTTEAAATEATGDEAKTPVANP